MSFVAPSNSFPAHAIVAGHDVDELPRHKHGSGTSVGRTGCDRFVVVVDGLVAVEIDASFLFRLPWELPSFLPQFRLRFQFLLCA